MGDCRIRIVIAKDLLSKEGIQQSAAEAEDIRGRDGGATVTVSETTTAISWTRIFSADTTVREVAHETPVLWKLFTTVNKNNHPSSFSSTDLPPFQLWDCTIHPPSDISDWPTHTFSEVTGPKSKTLHDAGCFPSGTWIALPRGMTPSQFSNTNYDEDAQYNNNRLQTTNQSETTTGASTGNNKSLVVEFKDPSLLAKTSSGALAASKPLPSQVLASVTQRFEEVDKEREAQAEQARAIRLENQAQLRKRQRERASKLDRRIQLLEDQSSEKNKKVSDQVRRMLVKSRATGETRLKLQDRLYFECLLDRNSSDEDDQALVREFRYFSPQDKFAKIASSFEGPPNKLGSEMTVEVLVKCTIPSGSSALEEYRRFPVAMRVYEAIAEKFLTGDQVDTLIIRWFADDSTDATPSILKVQDQTTTSISEEESSNDVVMADAIGTKDTTLEEEQQVASASSSMVDEVMTAAILAMDEANNKGKKPKKASAASIKVRNMQIKSKAKGDAKRIPKVEERFFLEVVQVDNGSGKASSTFHFLANKDPLERIIQSVASSTNTTDWDFFVPLADGESEKATYSKISDTSIELADAAAKGILKSFDRLILRPK